MPAARPVTIASFGGLRSPRENAIVTAAGGFATAGAPDALIGLLGMPVSARTLCLLLALAGMGLTAACETAAERQQRLEREAYIESLDLEELKGSLDTVNPDPYDPKKFQPNKGREKN